MIESAGADTERGIAQAADGVAVWLRAAARRPLAALFAGFCEELGRLGLPVARAALGVELLHPAVNGQNLIWTRNGGIAEQTVDWRFRWTSSYRDNPVRIVAETRRPWRQRLDSSALDLPLLHELRELGMTDYVIRPLPFLERERVAFLSFAADAARGFDDDELGRLAVAADLLGPYVERILLHRRASNLLETYIGVDAGRRVAQGQVQRGDVRLIRAAIWFCDLRGFTELSGREPPERVVETLNRWFDCVGDAVEAHGGEILKFIGDGLLAIFPATDDAERTCAAALAAVRDAVAAVDCLNAERAPGAQALHFGLALHVGDVAFGNIGCRRRLDFTAIGPAVNYASRLQELTKALGRTVLASEAFHQSCPSGLVALGPHPLRDIGPAEPVFGTE